MAAAVARGVSRPLCLIGLDGGSFAVLDPLLAAGDLPVLASVMARGAHGVLRSVVPPITPAAWTSFMTGKQPGRHGIYDFRLYEPRAYRDSFVSSRALHDATLWEILTAAGRRVAVVNLPMMYPPRPASGTVVSGFDTPSVDAAFTAPPELRARILERCPDYLFVAVPDPADPNLETDAAFSDFVAQVERGLEQRTRVALDLLADGPWDVFMLHHQDTDSLQHLAWRYIAGGNAEPERRERVRQAYRRLDALLGQVLAALPSDALTVILSDHGFGDHTGRLFPNVLLRKWGYLSWRGLRRTRARRWLDKRLARLGIERRRDRVDASWETRVRTQAFADALPLRWRKTRAYVALAEIYGLLYLNLRGREPEGIVRPGAEARALAVRLRERLLGVRDPRDGAPVFADVLHGEAVYPDDVGGRRPDLVLVPRPGYTLRRDLNPSLWVDHNRILSGTHRPEGILIVSGPGVRPGAVAAPPTLVDLAPTLLAYAGVPVPEDMDGRVLAELFTEPLDVRYAAPADAAERRDEALSAEEEDQVMERLRALGYLA
jgi:predicted AlkP superfamily phosphohydrolase/phosphomutase